MGAALAWGDDYETERLGSSAHARVVRHDVGEITSKAKRSCEVYRVGRAHRRRLDRRGPLEKIVIKSNEVNTGE